MEDFSACAAAATSGGGAPSEAAVTAAARARQSGGFLCVGTAFKYFCSEEEWKRMDKRLIPLKGDEDILVDRYDVRLMLTDVNTFVKKKHKVYSPEELDELLGESEALDKERYLDLPRSNLFEGEFLSNLHSPHKAASAADWTPTREQQLQRQQRQHGRDSSSRSTGSRRRGAPGGRFTHGRRGSRLLERRSAVSFGDDDTDKVTTYRLGGDMSAVPPPAALDGDETGAAEEDDETAGFDRKSSHSSCESDDLGCDSNKSHRHNSSNKMRDSDSESAGGVQKSKIRNFSPSARSSKSSRSREKLPEQAPRPRHYHRLYHQMHHTGRRREEKEEEEEEEAVAGEDCRLLREMKERRVSKGEQVALRPVDDDEKTVQQTLGGCLAPILVADESEQTTTAADVDDSRTSRPSACSRRNCRTTTRRRRSYNSRSSSSYSRSSRSSSSSRRRRSRGKGLRRGVQDESKQHWRPNSAGTDFGERHSRQQDGQQSDCFSSYSSYSSSGEAGVVVRSRGRDSSSSSRSNSEGEKGRRRSDNALAFGKGQQMGGLSNADDEDSAATGRNARVGMVRKRRGWRKPQNGRGTGLDSSDTDDAAKQEQSFFVRKRRRFRCSEEARPSARDALHELAVADSQTKECSEACEGLTVSAAVRASRELTRKRGSCHSVRGSERVYPTAPEKNRGRRRSRCSSNSSGSEQEHIAAVRPGRVCSKGLVRASQHNGEAEGSRRCSRRQEKTEHRNGQSRRARRSGAKNENSGKEDEEEEEEEEEGDEAAQEYQSFLPPSIAFNEVAIHMQTPRTLKEHLVIERTAHFVRSEGSRYEFQLKLNAVTSSRLPFLHIEHPLHAYYAYLRDSGEALLQYAPKLLPRKLLSLCRLVYTHLLPSQQYKPQILKQQKQQLESAACGERNSRHAEEPNNSGKSGSCSSKSNSCNSESGGVEEVIEKGKKSNEMPLIKVSSSAAAAPASVSTEEVQKYTADEAAGKEAATKEAGLSSEAFSAVSASGFSVTDSGTAVAAGSSILQIEDVRERQTAGELGGNESFAEERTPNTSREKSNSGSCTTGTSTDRDDSSSSVSLKQEQETAEATTKMEIAKGIVGATGEPPPVVISHHHGNHDGSSSVGAFEGKTDLVLLVDAGRKAKQLAVREQSTMLHAEEEGGGLSLLMSYGNDDESEDEEQTGSLAEPGKLSAAATAATTATAVTTATTATVSSKEEAQGETEQRDTVCAKSNQQAELSTMNLSSAQRISGVAAAPVESTAERCTRPVKKSEASSVEDESTAAFTSSGNKRGAAELLRTRSGRQESAAETATNSSWTGRRKSSSSLTAPSNGTDSCTSSRRDSAEVKKHGEQQQLHEFRAGERNTRTSRLDSAVLGLAEKKHTLDLKQEKKEETEDGVKGTRVEEELHCLWQSGKKLGVGFSLSHAQPSFRRQQREAARAAAAAAAAHGRKAVKALEDAAADAAAVDVASTADAEAIREALEDVPAVCWAKPNAKLQLSELSALITQQIGCWLLENSSVEMVDFALQKMHDDASPFRFLRKTTMDYRYYKYVLQCVLRHKQENRPVKKRDILWHDITRSFIARLQLEFHFSEKKEREMVGDNTLEEMPLTQQVINQNATDAAAAEAAAAVAAAEAAEAKAAAAEATLAKVLRRSASFSKSENAAPSLLGSFGSVTICQGSAAGTAAAKAANASGVRPDFQQVEQDVLAVSEQSATPLSLDLSYTNTLALEISSSEQGGLTDALAVRARAHGAAFAATSPAAVAASADICDSAVAEAAAVSPSAICPPDTTAQRELSSALAMAPTPSTRAPTTPSPAALTVGLTSAVDPVSLVAAAIADPSLLPAAVTKLTTEMYAAYAAGNAQLYASFYAAYCQLYTYANARAAGLTPTIPFISTSGAAPPVEQDESAAAPVIADTAGDNGDIADKCQSI